LTDKEIFNSDYKGCVKLVFAQNEKPELFDVMAQEFRANNIKEKDR
jgi:hypothetical protein